MRGSDMDIAYISAASALAGSVVGGFTTGLTTWISQRVQARSAFAAMELSRRQELFKEFIVVASETYGDALVRSEPQITKIVELYALTSRMRILCSRQTVDCADRVVSATMDAYFAPNVSLRELHEELRRGAQKQIDPLREFSEAARNELQLYRSA
ncbi:MAG: hypothetical protein JO094_02345 [Hyphomicrobiales bacterium]|nr:hypothetical protein [Hyphomicrobiales bacterium]